MDLGNGFSFSIESPFENYSPIYNRIMETKLSQIAANANFKKPACNIIGLSCVHRFADHISWVVLDKSLGVAQTKIRQVCQPINAMQLKYY